MKLFGKPYRWAVLYSLLLTLFTAYVLLDTFVIPRMYVVLENDNTKTESQSPSTGAKSPASEGGNDNAGAVTDKSYKDENISIAVTKYRENNTDIYVADIVLSSIDYLKTAFANNTYGRNVTQKTSAIAETQSAILAINGDFYGAQSKGYVIRNGTVYRDTVSDSDQEDLAILSNGSFQIVTEGSVSADELQKSGALQVLSFGPALVNDGKLAVSQDSEVDKAMVNNPRTAIGIIDGLHYLFVVSDGRTDASTGLTLYQLASFMEGLGAQSAYNLDGGGSSAMVFNGNVINRPTTNGKSINERAVSDIVYIGY